MTFYNNVIKKLKTKLIIQSMFHVIKNADLTCPVSATSWNLVSQMAYWAIMKNLTFTRTESKKINYRGQNQKCSILQRDKTLLTLSIFMVKEIYTFFFKSTFSSTRISIDWEKGVMENLCTCQGNNIIIANITLKVYFK